MIQIRRSNLKKISDLHYESLSPNIIRKLSNRDDLLSKFALGNLKTILIGSPPELSKLIIKIESLKEETSFFKKVFNYDSFVSTYSGKKYGAYNLAENLDVNVCPYCNRQYTFTLRGGKNSHGRTRPVFDHFYSQEKFPYLSLSFYNLIPCCNICNSSFKGRRDFSLANNIHPYFEGFEDDARFRIELRTKNKFEKGDVKKWFGVNFFSGAHQSFDIKISIINPISEKERKINRNIETFHLENLYNKHKDFVLGLVQMAEVYNSDYINSIYEQFEGKLFNNEYEVYQMILSNYIFAEDFDKRTLSKLTRDITEELGIDLPGQLVI